VTSAERRQFERLSLDVPLTLLVSGQAPRRGRIRDISMGGCFLVGDSEVRHEGRVALDFVVLPRAIYNATKRIVRAIEGDGFAVEFGAVNDELQRFVAELRAADPERRAECLSRILDPEIHVA
jgi:c-di-GMP-binding flagellar brake protein YcgR